MGAAGDAVRKRLTYANVVATLALFVALGGVTYAAIKLPADSVKSKQIKAGAVKEAELADGAVTGPKLGAEAVGSENIAPGAVGSTAVLDDSIQPGDIADDSIGEDELADDQAPQAPTLEPCAGGFNWATVPPGDLDPHYWIDRHQIVHLEGSVRCPAAMAGGGAIFQMPVEYRPDQNLVRYGQLGAGQSIAQIAVINGAFNPVVVYDGGSAANTEEYISLDGINYRAAGPTP